MSDGLVRVSVGTRFIHDGELMQVVEMQAAATGTVVVLGAASGGSTAVVRVALRELLDGGRARLLPDDRGPQADDDVDLASVVFAAMSEFERNELNERAAHVREVLTGYRSGSAELPAKDEPRGQYDPGMSLTSRYTAKAAEVGVSLRTIKQWVADFRRHGVAGLARKQSNRQKPFGNADDVWGETAIETDPGHAYGFAVGLARIRVGLDGDHHLRGFLTRPRSFRPDRSRGFLRVPVSHSGRVTTSVVNSREVGCPCRTRA